MSKGEVKDLRSTGRRRARRVLYESMEPYECVDCGVTSVVPPKDAPEWFNEIWPVNEKLLAGKTIASQLQADHESKDLEDNEIGFVHWRCSSCHALRDRQTPKGVSTRGEIEIY